MEFNFEWISLALLAFTGIAQGLTCYECNSWNTDSCHEPSSSVSAVSCTGSCKTTISMSGIERSCATSCTASSNIFYDTQCCTTDNCNSGGATAGSQWNQCYSCHGDMGDSDCKKKGFDDVTTKTYSYCQGSCTKVDAEGEFLGIKSKTTSRGCMDSCVEEEVDGDFGWISGKSDTKCCKGNLCNAAPSMAAAMGIIIMQVILTFTI